MSTRPLRFRPLPWWQWFLLLLSIFLFIGGLFWWQINISYWSFQTHSGVNANQLLEMWRQARLLTLDNDNGWTNFLLLGTDSLEYRDTSYPLTDTMMLASVHLDSGHVNLLPLPRDLYISGDNQRLNAYYPHAYQIATASAALVTSEEFSQLFALPIHYTLVISLADVKNFLDLIGGIDIFIDHQYPRDDVDIRVVHDPALLYETVEFTAGPTHLDGSTAMKFMRSRHAQNSEGSDFARSARQQQVISATTQKITQQLLQQISDYDFSFLGELYQFYDQHFATQINFVTILTGVRRFFDWGRLPTIANQKLDIGPALNIHEDPHDYTLRITNMTQL